MKVICRTRARAMHSDCVSSRCPCSALHRPPGGRALAFLAEAQLAARSRGWHRAQFARCPFASARESARHARASAVQYALASSALTEAAQPGSRCVRKRSSHCRSTCEKVPAVVGAASPSHEVRLTEPSSKTCPPLTWSVCNRMLVQIANSATAEVVLSRKSHLQF